MDLEELKALLGIDLEDVESDKVLKIKLEGALEITEKWFKEHAKKEYIKYDDRGDFIIPAGVKIAISKYIEVTNIVAGVRSESIGGMTQDFGGGSNTNKNNSPLDDFYAYLEAYKDKAVRFVPVRR